jgi:hypothetical protein
MELWISIHDGGSYGMAPHPVLLFREFVSDVAPLPGEQVEILPDWAVEVRDRGRYWRFDGTCMIEIKGLVVDPDEREQQYIGKWDSVWHERFTSWWTSEQGETREQLIARLIEAGWTQR